MSRRQWVVETVDSDGGDNTWAGHAANDREARRAALNHHEAALNLADPEAGPFIWVQSIESVTEGA